MENQDNDPRFHACQLKNLNLLFKLVICLFLQKEDDKI